MDSVMERLDNIIAMADENKLRLERCSQRLSILSDKYLKIEFNDFFKHVPYELTREEFDKELQEHEIDDWIPVHCSLKDMNEKDYRDKLWERYCGNGSVPKLGL
jgi:hypothetical protein